MSASEYRRDPEALAQLTTEQFDVTQRAATEPPFRNEFWDSHEVGLYVDVVSGEPLFTSLDKVDSGTGWPCFTAPVDTSSIVLKRTRTYDDVHTEVRSRCGDSHLGHLFAAGPPDAGGSRYCVNSAAMRFIPLDGLEEAGYGDLLSVFAAPAPPPSPPRARRAPIR